MKMITLLLIITLMSIFGKCKATQPEQTGPVTQCTYRESGMRHRIVYSYKQQSDGTCTLTFNNRWDDNKEKTIVVPASVGEDLWKMAKQYNMLKYKESYRPRMDFKDGIMWHLDMTFTTGPKLYTGGDNEWPGGGGIDSLEKYMRTTWNKYRPAITKFFYYLSETTAYPIHYAIIERDAEGAYWMTYAANCPRSEARKFQLSEDAYNRLYQIIEDHDMHDYQSSYEPEFMVLDGYMWTLEIAYDKGTPGIYSSGHNARPDEYGLQRLEDFITKQWEQNKGNSVPAPIQNNY